MAWQYPKTLLLNGPTLCGKGEAVKHIRKKLNTEGFELVEAPCKKHLHELVAKLFNIDLLSYYDLYENRDTKETPHEWYQISYDEFKRLTKVISVQITQDRVGDTPGMFKLSPREVLIYVSEVVCKPAFGDEYFGEARVRFMLHTDGYKKSPLLFVDDSCAFIGELQPLLREYSQKDILLLRIRGRGEFSPSDSRGYIPNGVIDNTIDVWNTGLEKNYLEEVWNHVEQFITHRG